MPKRLGPLGANREAIDRATEVAGGEVSVELGGRPRIGVAHDPLDGRQISARHDEQRGRRVPDVMEPKRAHLADRPELHLALRTPSNVRVGRQLRVDTSLAPTALPIAREDLRPPERASQNLFELHSFGHPAAVRAGKDEVAGRSSDRRLQVGQQLGRDRDGISVTSLRRIAIVRSLNGDEARAEIDVFLSQSEQLAFSHPGIEGGREQALPMRRQVRQHRYRLIGLQVVGQAPWDLPFRNVADRVWPHEAAGTPGHVERPSQVSAQVIQALRREVLGFLFEEGFDVTRVDVGQPAPAERRSDDVFANRSDARVVGRLLCEELGRPPLDQLVDGPAAVFGGALVEAVARPILSNLDLAQQLDGLSFGPGVADLVAPAPGRVLVFEVPATTPEIWLRHDFDLPSGSIRAQTGAHFQDPTSTIRLTASEGFHRRWLEAQEATDAQMR